MHNSYLVKSVAVTSDLSTQLFSLILYCFIGFILVAVAMLVHQHDFSTFLFLYFVTSTQSFRGCSAPTDSISSKLSMAQLLHE